MFLFLDVTYIGELCWFSDKYAVIMVDGTCLTKPRQLTIVVHFNWEYYVILQW